MKLNNNIEIPNICFGTALLQGPDCINAVINAIEVGIRAIDTAQSYNNESEVGCAIKSCIDRGIVKREELFVVTKLNAHNPIGYQEAIVELDNSLKKLDLDYIDLYMIHAPNMTSGDKWKGLNAETWKAFEELYRQGKSKSIGVSNFMIHHLEELSKTAKIKPMVNQIELNPQWQQKELVSFCKSNNIVCMGAYSLMWGLIKDNKILDEVAGYYNKTVPQILLRWQIQKCFVPVFKSSSADRIKSNIDVFDFNIDEQYISKIDAMNSNPIGACATTPDSWYSYYLLREAYSTKTTIEKEIWKLFNFFILFKIKKTKEDVFICYLFGFLPIFTKRIVSPDKEKIYLFNVLPILNIKKKLKVQKPENLLPIYPEKK